jgi:hypothetical protein
MSRAPWHTGRIREKVAKRIQFTPELWEKWHQARKPDADTARLRQGIRVMRALLERPHDREPAIADRIDNRLTESTTEEIL